MKNAIILELAEKWEREVLEGKEMPRDGAPEAAIGNAKQDAADAMKAKLARQLREVVTLLG